MFWWVLKQSMHWAVVPMGAQTVYPLGSVEFAEWYHAVALELDEERLFDLMVFRCCKCRRIKLPIYPVEKPVSEGRNLRRGDLKQGNMGVDYQLAPFSSLSKAEHVSDEKTPEVNMNSLPGSRNISVWRHIMQNNTMVFLPENNFTVDTSVNLAENSLRSAVETSSCKDVLYLEMTWTE
ncbi:hypothetical protein AgCh_005207 [Apium graveolens]